MYSSSDDVNKTPISSVIPLLEVSIFRALSFSFVEDVLTCAFLDTFLKSVKVLMWETAKSPRSFLSKRSGEMTTLILFFAKYALK